MKLDQHYSIETDNHNVILRYYKEGELNDKGKPKISRSETYYPSMEKALQGYLNKCVKDSITPNSDADTILHILGVANENILTMLQNQKETA